MIEAIKKYQLIKKNIPQLLEVSGYRNDFIAKKIGMKPQYFSVKKQRGNWSDKDVQKIIEVLTAHNDEVENYLMLEEMPSLKDAETVSYEEYKKEVASWK